MASIVDTRLYDILGVSPNASDSDLKKAFRRLAKECHPDKNPNATAAEKFKELNFAYEVLSNPEKRDIYNRLGEKGLREGGDSSSMDDIFSHIFGGSSLFGGFLGGGMHSRGGSSRRRRGEDMVHPLKVSLEDLYNGKVTKLQLSKNVICAGCKGIGGKAGSVQPCATCKGRGFRIVVQQLVPGMVQQMKSVCHICRGEGEIMNERDRCKQCEGKKVVKEVKILEVHVDKGMRQGQKITFRGEGDQAPDMEPGDIILVLQEKEHEMFRRNGNDLHMTKRVGLCEALCGVCFALNHLDGRQILVTSPAGKVIYPGCTQGVCGEGMPMYRNPFEKGDLYIKFDIEFPENNWIDAERLQELEQLLPARPDIQHPVGDYEDVDLHDLESTKGGGAGARREAYDDGSDDEGGYHHGQGVQCTHQ